MKILILMGLFYFNLLAQNNPGIPFNPPTFSGTALPALCNNGSRFYNVSNYTWYSCGPVNVWSSETGGAPGPTGPIGPQGAMGTAGAGVANTVMASSYGNIALACASVPTGGYVAVDVNRTAPTQTLNCNLWPQGGVIQPNSGALVAFNGNVFGPNNVQLFDMSAGGHLDVSQNKLIGEITMKQLGAKCDGATNDTVAFSEMIRATIVNQAAAGAAYVGTVINSGSCMVGNISATNNSFPAGCQMTGTSGCYAPRYIRGEAGIFSTDAAKLKAIGGTTGYVLSALGIVHTTMEGFTVDGSGIANCINASWPDSGPSLINKFNDLHLEGCNGFGLRADNNNDSIIDRLQVDTSSSGYALYMAAPGGSVYGITHLNTNHNKVFIDAQNAKISDSYLNYGLEMCADSFCHMELDNTQVEVAGDTGIVINSLANGFNGLASLACVNCYLAPSGIGAGQSILSGRWSAGGFFDGGYMDLGVAGGVLFGAGLANNYSGFYPTFHFKNFRSKNGLPTFALVGVGHYYYVCESCINGGAGTLFGTPFAVDTRQLTFANYNQQLIGGALIGSGNTSNNTFALTDSAHGTDFFVADDTSGNLYLKAQGGQNVNLVIGGSIVANVGAGGINLSNGIGFGSGGATIPFFVSPQIPRLTLAGAGTCNGSTEGALVMITDSTTNTWGAVITSGVSVGPVGGICNGTAWTVFSK